MSGYELIYPKNLPFELPFPVHPHVHSAMIYMENNHICYKPGWVDPVKFGILDRIVKSEIDNGYYQFTVNYKEPYGLMHREGGYMMLDKVPDTHHKQTYCTLGVACFLWYYTKAQKLTYKKARGKHPIHAFCQSSANACARQLEKGMDYPKWALKPITIVTGVELAGQGKLVIAAWENKKGPGHVSTIIGYDREPMCYNIGAVNGYMSLDKSFGGMKKKDIKYYVLEEKAKN